MIKKILIVIAIPNYQCLNIYSSFILQEELVLFMSREDVEMLLGVGNTNTKYSENLELKLQVERGPLNQMECLEPSYSSQNEQTALKYTKESEKVTIVLDPKKGIYSLDSTQKADAKRASGRAFI